MEKEDISEDDLYLSDSSLPLLHLILLAAGVFSVMLIFLGIIGAILNSPF